MGASCSGPDGYECPIRPNMTYEELTEEIIKPQLYCTSQKVWMDTGRFHSVYQLKGTRAGGICRRLLSEIERAKKEEDQRDRYNKLKAEKMRKQGFNDEEINKVVSKPGKKRRGRKAKRTVKLAPINWSKDER